MLQNVRACGAPQPASDWCLLLCSAVVFHHARSALLPCSLHSAAVRHAAALRSASFPAPVFTCMLLPSGNTQQCLPCCAGGCHALDRACSSHSASCPADGLHATCSPRAPPLLPCRLLPPLPAMHDCLPRCSAGCCALAICFCSQYAVCPACQKLSTSESPAACRLLLSFHPCTSAWTRWWPASFSCVRCMTGTSVLRASCAWWRP